MQKLLLQLTGLAFILSTVFTTGCETDAVDPVDPLGPVISFVNEAGFLNSDAVVDAGGTFAVKLSVLPGDNTVQAISVYEDGVKLSTDRMVIDGGATISNNPFTISESGGSYELEITAVTPG